MVFFNKGIVTDLLCHDQYLLVATTTGIYLVSETEKPEYIAQFGGSTDISSPYRLNIDVGLPKLTTLSKRVSLNCKTCSAEARYANATETEFFCSRYCLHKSLARLLH